MPAEIYSLLNLDAYAGIILPITRACLRIEAYWRRCLQPFHGRRNRALSVQDKLWLEENQAKELRGRYAFIVLRPAVQKSISTLKYR